MSETNTSGKRQIKASEVKPGMEIEIVTTRKMTVHRVFTWDDSHWEVRDDSGHVTRVDADAKITVLSEPAPAQPEEPTALGARVVVGEHRFILVDNDSTPWLNMNTWMWYSWGELCNMGTVTVIDADPCWTAPADREPTPEVPDRIEVWPENDEHLRAHRWKDQTGWIWKHHGEVGGGWIASRPGSSATSFSDGSRPCDGPWTIADETRP